MKTIRLGLVMIVAAVTGLAAPEVTVTCVDETPAEVLQLYVSLSHKKVNVPREVAGARERVSVTIKGKPADRAAKILEQALRTQAHIELIPQSDGSMTAHVIVPGS